MPGKCVFTSWCVPVRGTALAVVGWLCLGHSASRADDPDPAAAKPVAPNRSAASQKADAQQKVSAAVRARRAREMRATIAYDDVFGAGAGSLAQAAALSGGSGTNSGATASTGYGSTFAGNGFSPAFSGTGASFSRTGTAGTISTGAGTSGSGTADSGGSGNTSGQTPSTTFNAKILQFARDHLGQQVGNGECWTLAEDALIYAGAKPANQYVFGDAIPLSSAQPGDILQFESVILIGANYWMILGTPHHTAIVDQIQGGQIQMLNQNVNGVLRVQYSTINLADLHSGTITAYRAISKDSTTTNDESPNAPPATNPTPGCNKQSGNSSSGTGAQSGNGSKSANCPSNGTTGTATDNNSKNATVNPFHQRRSVDR